MYKNATQQVLLIRYRASDVRNDKYMHITKRRCMNGVDIAAALADHQTTFYSAITYGPSHEKKTKKKTIVVFDHL